MSTHDWSGNNIVPSFPLHNNNNNNNKLASYLASYLDKKKREPKITIAHRVDPVLYEETNHILKRVSRKNTFMDWLNDQLFQFVRNHAEDMPKCTLDSFNDPDFVACPDFYKNMDIWNKYLEHLSQDHFKKWDLQLNDLLKLSVKHNRRKFH